MFKEYLSLNNIYVLTIFTFKENLLFIIHL